MAQGPIADRTKEYLAQSDISIVRARRAIRRALDRHCNGSPRPEFDRAIAWNEIRSFSEIVAEGTDWRTLPR
jgi:hypothetical protein